MKMSNEINNQEINTGEKKSPNYVTVTWSQQDMQSIMTVFDLALKHQDGGIKLAMPCSVIQQKISKIKPVDNQYEMDLNQDELNIFVTTFDLALKAAGLQVFGNVANLYQKIINVVQTNGKTNDVEMQNELQSIADEASKVDATVN